MSRYDATQSNESTRSSKIFKDLNLDFQQNTATKDIQKITDAESVKRSVTKSNQYQSLRKTFPP